MRSPHISRRGFLYAGTAGAALAAFGNMLPATARASAATSGAPDGLLTDLLREGLGVGSGAPRLSWQVPALVAGTGQTHYQLQVSRDPDVNDPVWDSGKVASAASVAVPYDGPALQPGTAYWWRVRTWDEPHLSAWSGPALIGTAPDWSATPIWTPAAPTIADGTLSFRVEITTVAASVWFRASGANANYLWQFRAGTPGVLKTHVCVNGAYTVLGQQNLSTPLTAGTWYDVTIELSGSTFRTLINGVLVDTTTNGTYATGTVGVRNGSTESSVFDDFRFTAAGGAVLVDDDFSTDKGTFGTGTVASGVFTLGNGQSGLASYGPDDSWALLRHEFTLPDKPIAAAVLHAAALSPDGARQYPAKIWCNGSVAGYASVRSADTPRYHSYNITEALRPGRPNVLAALAYTTTDKRFLAQLEVTHADGSRLTVGTGTGWKARREAGLLRDAGSTGGGFYAAPQEYWDLRHEPTGWTEPGFDDSAWPDAVARAAIDGLAAAGTEPVALFEVTPAAVTRLADGHYLVDLGKEIAGGLALQVTGTVGQRIEVRLGEELNADGTVRYALRAGQTFREYWTLRDGKQHIEHWGYRGFRYAELIGPAGLDPAVTGRAWRQAWRSSDASFTSSDASLDRVYEFCRYTIEATRSDLYVDTPTRERGPYEGDALINQRSEYATQRSYALARASDRYLTRKGTWPTEYRLMNIVSAWLDYLHTGDDRQLAADYDLLVAKNLTRYLGSDGLVHKAPGSSSQDLADLVDWPAANRDGYVFTTVNTVINAFQYAAFDASAKIAEALGKGGSGWRGKADALATALRHTLLDTANGRFYDGLGTTHSAQHATAFPVALGVAAVGDDVLKALGDTLAAGGMKVSIYGAQFLLEALFAAGRADAAIELMTATGTDSWLHLMDDLGATIAGEAWDPSLKPNMTFSHAWGSAPANIIPRYVLGVEITAPGAAELTVRPRLATLTSARGKVPTIRGAVEIAVTRSDRSYELRANLPPNTSTTLLVEIGDDDPRAYHVDATPAPGAKQVTMTVETDLTGQVLRIGPVGSGAARVHRDSRN